MTRNPPKSKSSAGKPSAKYATASGCSSQRCKKAVCCASPAKSSAHKARISVSAKTSAELSARLAKQDAAGLGMPERWYVWRWSVGVGPGGIEKAFASVRRIRFSRDFRPIVVLQTYTYGKRIPASKLALRLYGNRNLNRARRAA